MWLSIFILATLQYSFIIYTITYIYTISLDCHLKSFQVFVFIINIVLSNFIGISLAPVRELLWHSCLGAGLLVVEYVTFQPYFNFAKIVSKIIFPYTIYNTKIIYQLPSYRTYSYFGVSILHLLVLFSFVRLPHFRRSA